MQTKYKSFFGFLSRGVTTTHPLCSVFTILICFVFIISVPCRRVAAAAVQPSFSPISGSTVPDISLVPEMLAPEQLNLFYIIMGAQAMNYSGLATYKLDEPYSDPDNVVEWLKNLGIRLYNDIAYTSSTLSFGMVDPLLDYIHGAYVQASALTPSSDSNTVIRSYILENPTKFMLPTSPEMLLSLNQWFAIQSGIDQWQYSDPNFTPFVWYTVWNNREPTANELANYLIVATNFDNPTKFNQTNDDRAIRWLCDFDFNTYFGTYHNVFFNTSRNHFDFYNDSGQIAPNPTVDIVDLFYDYYEGYITRTDRNELYFGLDYSGDYTTFPEYFFGTNPIGYRLGSSYKISFDLSGVDWYFYAGPTWQDALPISVVSGLNLGDLEYNPPLEVPDRDTVFDLPGALEDLAEDNDNLEEIAKDNNLDPATGEPLADADYDPNSTSPKPPASGIVVPGNIFSKLGKYISYLYDLAKPLVLYTRDLLTCFTFDGTGLSWVFYGAVSCGLIGGVLCKFLL